MVNRQNITTGLNNVRSQKEQEERKTGTRQKNTQENDKQGNLLYNAYVKINQQLINLIFLHFYWETLH